MSFNIEQCDSLLMLSDIIRSLKKGKVVLHIPEDKYLAMKVYTLNEYVMGRVYHRYVDPEGDIDDKFYATEFEDLPKGSLLEFNNIEEVKNTLEDIFLTRKTMKELVEDGKGSKTTHGDSLMDVLNKLRNGGAHISIPISPEDLL